MKVLAIIMIFLCNYTLTGESPTKGIHLTRSELQSKDSVTTNNLRIRPFNLEIVPPSSGVQFYRSGIIFLSHSQLEEKVPEHHLSFGSVRIYTSLVSDTIPFEIKPFDFETTTLFPSEATTFTADFNTMYLSLIPTKSRSEKIFRADYTADGWKIEEEPLEICNDDYIYSHPCLSADGTFMLFSSDQSGTVGGLDLWLTRKSGEGWSKPENIGKRINSPGNELFAALDSKNNIYFSSDGHQGKGGYDIFIASFNGSTWDEPHILPEAINTKDDELAYTVDKTDSKTAFYTTRSRNGKSRTQLFIIDSGLEQLQNLNKSISDNILAMAERSISTTNNSSVPVTETPEADKEKTSSDQLAQPGSIVMAGKEEAPEQPRIRENQRHEVKMEVAIEPKQTTTAPLSEEKNDKVIYRVQILANTKPVGSQNISVAGRNFKSFEYLYKGGYRTTIGEFGTLAEAVRLQNTCRQNGYKEAFVVAFKNNVRSTDPALFQ